MTDEIVTKRQLHAVTTQAPALRDHMRELTQTEKRRFIRLRRVLEPLLDLLGLAALTGLFISFLPLEILKSGPATGGDTGSHYWTLYGLFKHGLPEGVVRVWNPGNQAGEPRLLHYFPFPFLVMSLFGLIVPLGTAFNWGTILGTAAFPFCVYYCFRGLGFRFPVPLLVTALVLPSHYNESFSMWGGNTLSTLAGQFAHSYALDLFLLMIGALGWEIRNGYRPFLSSLLASGVFISHGYPALCLPLLAALFPPAFPYSRFPRRFIHVCMSLVWSVALSLWFIIPMIANRKWNTKLVMAWSSTKLFQEIFPETLHPLVGAGALGAVLLAVFWYFRLLVPKFSSRLRLILLWSGLTAFYAVLYPILPKIGLIDVRTVPQIQLFGSILCALLFAMAVASFGRVISLVVTPPLFVACIWWTQSQVKMFPTWLQWNVSGWDVKPLHDDVVHLSDKIRGTFSEPRVTFELSDQSNASGTIRVWEMLPYFSGRATLESVYLEATLLAPETVYIQAEISKFPSCPFHQFHCVHWDVPKSLPRLALMGVDTLILVTNETVSQARSSPLFRNLGEFGPWKVFQTVVKPSFVDVMTRVPTLYSGSNWQNDFYDWFVSYDGTQPSIVVKNGLSPELLEVFHDMDVNREKYLEGCNPTVEVYFNRLVLHTPCPGRPHVLKFNYHPTWKANTGDETFIVSPGFLGIVPSANTVELRFGQSKLWTSADIISLLSFILLAGFRLRAPLRKIARKAAIAVSA